jgi:ABC-type antimicrobial peptide transport system permease subunit
MSPQAIIIILSRYLKQKWGRVLLASAGIMIGVWAITLTTSLSLTVQSTLVQAVNSQTIAREIAIQKLENEKTDLFELTGPPVYKGISRESLANIKSKYTNIVEVVPSSTAVFLAHNPEFSKIECVNTQEKITPISSSIGNRSESSSPADTVDMTNSTESDKLKEELKSKCLELNLISYNFQNFYEANRKNWTGKNTQPDKNEVVLCFRCGNTELNKKYKVSSPEEMIGKTFSGEFSQSPDYLLENQLLDVINPPQNEKNIKTSKSKEFKIVAVIDDREREPSSINLSYFNFEHFEESIIQANPKLSAKDILYAQADIYIDDYNNLDKVINQLKSEKFLTISIAQFLIQSIQVVFQILIYVLSGFGLIALIASVFGIINVMTISALERRKEIGILKSLGAKDRDIFILFIVESGFLGFFGWILGTLSAYFSVLSILTIYKAVVDNNAEWRSNLETLNIDQISINMPFWLLLTTLGVAMFFTLISGLLPSLSAARQNPVDVLRNE